MEVMLACQTVLGCSKVMLGYQILSGQRDDVRISNILRIELHYVGISGTVRMDVGDVST